MKTKCSVCSELDDPDNFMGCNEKIIMKRDNVCFSCAFWIEQRRIIENGRTPIINSSYCVFWPENRIPENKPGCGRWENGYHGAKAKIELITGETYYSDNVWCTGTVPEYFRMFNCFSPNAKITIGIR